jgi:hydroxyacylglutathione hydrolase
MKLGAVVVDTRAPPAFGGAHIGSAYNIRLNRLPLYAGWVLPYDKPIILVLGDRGDLETAVRFLIRLGYDQIAGYLREGMDAWYKEAFPTEQFGLLTVQELKKRLDSSDEIVLLDVREKSKWDQGHIKGARHIYAGHVERHLGDIPSDRPIGVVCNTGNHASLVASILRREGYREVSNVLGGMAAWQAAGYKLVK